MVGRIDRGVGKDTSAESPLGQTAHPVSIEPFSYFMNRPSLSPAQSSADAETLKLLAIFHFIIAGLLLLALGLIANQIMQVEAVFSDVHGDIASAPVPLLFTPGMEAALFCLIAMAVLMGTGNLLSALYILQRRNRVFSLVIAGLNFLHIPLGTALGVFTFVVLMRDSVRRLYQEAATP